MLFQKEILDPTISSIILSFSLSRYVVFKINLNLLKLLQEPYYVIAIRFNSTREITNEFAFIAYQEFVKVPFNTIISNIV